MRTNLPVTNVEYPITDETLIVSKTDLKGKLTYFNDQFVDASGFTEQELMGQPHNIIRHPDMPPEAFGNLWDTLKAGKPWAGAVKNRRKNGDFYWVLASATPIWEGGKVSGYMSIRTKLPSDQRDEAERVYALFRANKAQAYTLIRRRGPPPYAGRPFDAVHRHIESTHGHADGGSGRLHGGCRRGRHPRDTGQQYAVEVGLRGSRGTAGAAVRHQRPHEGQYDRAL